MDKRLRKESPMPFSVIVGDIYKTKVNFSSCGDSLEYGSHLIVREIYDNGDVEIDVIENGVSFALSKSELETMFTDGSLEIGEAIDMDLYNARDDL